MAEIRARLQAARNSHEAGRDTAYTAAGGCMESLIIISELERHLRNDTALGRLTKVERNLTTIVDQVVALTTLVNDTVGELEVVQANFLHASEKEIKLSKR